MQVDILFFKHINDGKKLFIPNSIVALGGLHFFGNKCNRVENELSILRMFLREDPKGYVIGSVHFNKSFEFRIKMTQNRS